MVRVTGSVKTNATWLAFHVLAFSLLPLYIENACVLQSTANSCQLSDNYPPLLKKIIDNFLLCPC